MNFFVYVTKLFMGVVCVALIFHPYDLESYQRIALGGLLVLLMPSER